MFVAAQAVKGESRQSGQSQKAVGDILFRITTELISRRRQIAVFLPGVIGFDLRDRLLRRGSGVKTHVRPREPCYGTFKGGHPMAKKPALALKSTSKSLVPHSLFGLPPVLKSEDLAAYDALLAHVSKCVKPKDILEKI